MRMLFGKTAEGAVMSEGSFHLGKEWVYAKPVNSYDIPFIAEAVICGLPKEPKVFHLRKNG